MEVARRRADVQLVSVDSMQVYRRMDIGTAKPSAAERAEVTHHCLDLVDPDSDFTVAQFKSAHTNVPSTRSPGRVASRCWSAAPASITVSSSTISTSRGSGPTARRIRSRRRHRRAVRAVGRARSGGGSQDRAGEPTADHPCPRGHGRQRASLQFVRSRRRRLPGHGRRPDRPAPTPPGAGRTHRRPCPSDDRPWPRRRGALDRRRLPASRGPPPRRSATRKCSSTSTAGSVRMKPST